jgi:hypothetical protein
MDRFYGSAMKPGSKESNIVGDRAGAGAWSKGRGFDGSRFKVITGYTGVGSTGQIEKQSGISPFFYPWKSRNEYGDCSQCFCNAKKRDDIDLVTRHRMMFMYNYPLVAGFL